MKARNFLPELSMIILEHLKGMLKKKNTSVYFWIGLAIVQCNQITWLLGRLKFWTCFPLGFFINKWLGNLQEWERPVPHFLSRLLALSQGGSRWPVCHLLLQPLPGSSPCGYADSGLSEPTWTMALSEADHLTGTEGNFQLLSEFPSCTFPLFRSCCSQLCSVLSYWSFRISLEPVNH